jgi:predicted O-methyltransferase YrrM
MDVSKAFDFEHFLGTYKGGVSFDEGHALSNYAASVKDGCIVEIGTFRGKSAICLAHGVVRADSVKKARIFCIDPHEPFVGVLGGQFGPKDRGEFYRIMLESGYFSNVALINLPSKQVSEGWQEPVGFLFIDGDHRYEAVREDFIAWQGFVSKGGIIAFDDTEPRELGPLRLVEEIVASRKFKLIDKVGKITFIRKESDELVAPSIIRKKRFLVLCDELSVSGGLLRFDRVGKELQRLGHELVFLPLSGNVEAAFPISCPVVLLEDAILQHWDVCMIPGQGFRSQFFEKLTQLEFDKFGYRVQHILNDKHLLDGFLRVNEIFEPDLVTFNNRHWVPGDFSGFKARKFTYNIGAVDLARFAPTHSARAGAAQKIIIGTQSKSSVLAQLSEVIRRLPDHYCLRIFGPALSQSPLDDLILAGRVEFVGYKFDANLEAFYHGCDCILHAEQFSGWANMAAEALACGVPLVATRQGALDFARDRETAMIFEPGNVDEAVAAILEVTSDKDLSSRLSKAGREAILNYGWPKYVDKLLSDSEDDGLFHYTFAPELGLHGKWPLSQRLDGLGSLIAGSAGQTVLDLGCAEGGVSLQMLQSGAALVHGFDAEASRIKVASRVCAAYPHAVFQQADLRYWSRFSEEHVSLLRPSYDVVLYLGLHHHLPSSTRLTVVAGATALARSYFAMRTTKDAYHEDGLVEFILGSGFTLVSETDTLGYGPIKIFERI